MKGTYAYIAKNPNGGILQGEIEGKDTPHATRELTKRITGPYTLIAITDISIEVGIEKCKQELKRTQMERERRWRTWR